jgi:6-phospho-beta-glucosidase
VKLVVIGAGGFRMPALYESLIGAAGRLGIADLVLHDTDPDRLARIAPVLDGLDAEHGASLPRRTTTSLDDALDGADVVYSAVRAGGVAARLVDESVPVRHGVIGQETTGPGGIAFALRTVPVMQALAHRVAARAPKAVVVNFTNPAGLVTEAMQRVLGDRVIGICDAPPDLCRRVATALGRTTGELEFSYAGLNHLGWLTAARDRDGRDLLPSLLADEAALAATEEGQLFGVEWLRTLGAIPNEYLYYYYRSREAVAAMQAQGTRAAFLAEQQAAFYEQPAPAPADALAAWRRAKLQRETTYMRDAYVARGADLAAVEAARAAGSGGYGAVAIGVVEAIARGAERQMILNVANGSSLPFLDATAVVEVACAVGRDGATPLAAPTLPPHARGLVESVKAVERLAIDAAETGSRRLAHEALALHPLVASIDTASAILDEYLAGHPDLRALLA